MSDYIATTVYSFDCDGVVLNSNKMKLDAMFTAILSCGFTSREAESCIEFFQNNFGLSRYIHVNHFLDKILFISGKTRDYFEKKILNSYSVIVSKNYVNAEFCEGFLDFMGNLDGPCNVVSGSDQVELIEVLKRKGLQPKFDYILGSPISKKDNLINLKKSYPESTLHLYFGDSIADLLAAKVAGYDFVGVLGYSLVASQLKTLCRTENYQFVDLLTESI